MFDVGWPELLVIAIVLIVVVGPKDLPDMLRQFGRTAAKLRAMAGDFRKQFDEALKEADMEDVRDLADQARGLNPRNAIRKHLGSFEQAGQDIKAGLDAAMKPKVDTSAEPASPVTHEAESLKTAAPDANTPPAKTNGVAKAPARKTTAKASRKPAAKAKPDAAAKTATARTAAKAPTAAKPAKTNGSAQSAAAGAKAKPVAAKPRAASAKTPASKVKPVAKPRSRATTRGKDKSGSAS